MSSSSLTVEEFATATAAPAADATASVAAPPVDVPFSVESATNSLSEEYSEYYPSLSSAVPACSDYSINLEAEQWKFRYSQLSEEFLKAKTVQQEISHQLFLEQEKSQRLLQKYAIVIHNISRLFSTAREEIQRKNQFIGKIQEMQEKKVEEYLKIIKQLKEGRGGGEEGNVGSGGGDSMKNSSRPPLNSLGSAAAQAQPWKKQKTQQNDKNQQRGPGTQRPQHQQQAHQGGHYSHPGQQKRKFEDSRQPPPFTIAILTEPGQSTNQTQPQQQMPYQPAR